jgi:hypothetical protein
MNTVVIVAETTDLIRDGLRSQISLAGAHVASADEQPDGRTHTERYQDPLRCQDALRALLQEIGWNGSPGDQKIDLDTHAWALLEALGDQIIGHVDKLRDIASDDERRETVMRDMSALSALGVIVLLRTQSQLLRPKS